MDEESALANVSGDGEVRNCPRGLFLCLEVAAREMADDKRHEARVDHTLHLRLIPGCDVREEPHGLLIHLLFRVLQQRGEEVQSAFAQHCLRLLVGASHNVAHSAQSGGLRKTNRIRDYIEFRIIDEENYRITDYIRE